MELFSPFHSLWSKWTFLPIFSKC